MDITKRVSPLKQKKVKIWHIMSWLKISNEYVII